MSEKTEFEAFLGDYIERLINIIGAERTKQVRDRSADIIRSQIGDSASVYEWLKAIATAVVEQDSTMAVRELSAAIDRHFGPKQIH